ncbi:MAG: FtsQ-type POTRA domain-containing protein [Acidobacteriota bacterium]|nr:MAG: FtsQ-type POTRA domain-containing protein [Acidobacteriota bacterium]
MPRKTTKTRTRRAKAAPRARKKTGGSKLINFAVPLFLAACILFCLGLLFSAAFRSAASSDFFRVRNVETLGAERVSSKKVEQIVRAEAFRSGVWSADLGTIRDEVEKLTFVRHASVSRVLPDTVRVTIEERRPVAIVRIGESDYLVDAEATVLAKITKDVKGPVPPFVMTGWDPDRSEAASAMNLKRVELYVRLVEEWRRFGLARRVRSLDLSDIKDPQAKVEDSGETVTISLGEGDYAEGLQKGLETIAGKGGKIKYVIAPNDPNPVVGYRNS